MTLFVFGSKESHIFVMNVLWNSTIEVGCRIYS